MHLKTLLKTLTRPGRVLVLAGPGFRPAGRAGPGFRLGQALPVSVDMISLLRDMCIARSYHGSNKNKYR